MCRTAVGTLAAQGHTVTVSDLYAQRFNPVASAADFAERRNPDYLNYALEQRHAQESPKRTLPGRHAGEVSFGGGTSSGRFPQTYDTRVQSKIQAREFSRGQGCLPARGRANRRNVFTLLYQVIRENPANRGTETSAEDLVGPPGRMVSNAGPQQWYGGDPCTLDGGPIHLTVGFGGHPRYAPAA